MAILSRDYGVNDIIISAMIYRRGKFLKEAVKRINFLLKLFSKVNGYFLIGNINTEIRYLWKDGIHLLQLGKTMLAENFICFLNSSYWLFPYDNFLEAHTHGHIEHSYFQLLNTKNCESISTKSILNTNTSNVANIQNNVLNIVKIKKLA